MNSKASIHKEQSLIDLGGGVCPMSAAHGGGSRPISLADTISIAAEPH